MPHNEEHNPAAGDDEVTDSEEMIGISDHTPRQIPNSIKAEESHRVFQKLWTHADELTILHKFLEFTSKRGTTQANYQHDTEPFFDSIKPLLQFDFSKNQIAEKLRRLKKKYHNAASKMGDDRSFAFKSPHDRATYEISHRIWSSMFCRRAKSGSEGGESVSPAAVAEAAAGKSVEEEAVRICVAPVLKELVQFAVAGMSAAAPAVAVAVEGNERWRRQRIVELEVCLKRMEIVEEWVRSALEKLRAMGS